MARKQTIKSITFTNLKGLKNVTIDFNPDKEITGIFGTNGCGKSTILHALLCMYKPEGNIGDNFKFNVFFKGGESNDNWKGSSFIANISQEAGKKHTMEDRNIKYQKKDRWSPRYTNRPKRSVFFIGIDTCVPDIEKEPISRRNILTEKRLELDKGEKICQTMASIMNRGYRSVYMSKCSNRGYVSLHRDDCDYRSLAMGAGEQRLFKLVKLFYDAPEYSLIVIDEIDLTLHTEALNRLLDFIKERSKADHYQVVFTSHREEILKRKDINIRHLWQTANGTQCLNNTTSDCIRQLTGIQNSPYKIFVEDDVAKAIVNEVLREEQKQRLCKISTFGALSNAFTIAAGLYNADILNDKFLIVTDGDVCKNADDIAKGVKSVLSGTEPSHSEKCAEVASHITYFISPNFVAPEIYIHSTLVNMDINSEIIEAARSIQAVTDKHEYVDRIVAALNSSPREVTLSRIIDLIKTTEGWSTYTQNIRQWVQGIS